MSSSFQKNKTPHFIIISPLIKCVLQEDNYSKRRKNKDYSTMINSCTIYIIYYIVWGKTLG